MILVFETIGNNFNSEDYLFMTRNVLRTYFGALESYYYYYYYYTGCPRRKGQYSGRS